MPLAAPPSEALEPPPWERRGLAFSTIVHPRADRASLSRLPCFTIAFTVLHYRVYRASLSRPRHDPTPDRPRPRQGGGRSGRGCPLSLPTPSLPGRITSARRGRSARRWAALRRRTWPGGPGPVDLGGGAGDRMRSWDRRTWPGGPGLSQNPPKDTDGRSEGSGRGWERELQGRWPGVLG